VRGRGRTEREVVSRRHVGADADDDVPVPGLWHAVLLEAVEVRHHVIAFSREGQFPQDCTELVAVVARADSADVLRHEPERGVGVQHRDAGLVQFAEIGVVHSLSFAYFAEAVAGEAERERVDAVLPVEVVAHELPCVHADAAAEVGVEGVDGGLGEVDSPGVAQGVGFAAERLHGGDARGGDGHAAWPAKEFAEVKSHRRPLLVRLRRRRGRDRPCAVRSRLPCRVSSGRSCLPAGCRGCTRRRAC